MTRAAGRRRNQIEILAEVRSTDAGGGADVSWAVIATGARWADVRPLSGSESYVAAQLQGLVTHRITVDYLPGDLTAVTNANRIRIVADGRQLDVHQAIDWENRHEELTLICTERKAGD